MKRGTASFQKICTTRDDTRESLQDFLSHPNEYNSSTFGDGPMLVSDIPASAAIGPVVVGIDEAGRGPALGPMVYGAAFWKESLEVDNGGDDIPKGLMDSKALTTATRTNLLEQLLDAPHVGFVVRVLPASEISRNMLRYPTPYNLNAMSHDAAMSMIRILLQQKVVISKCYVDTVGDPKSYQRRLEQAFPDIQFCVEPKADANYISCSAASVVAKVVRDEMLVNWKSDDSLVDLDFGSGYPSDPKCVAWMERNLQDPIFGYPNNLVRFSWNPIKKSLANNKKAMEVTFAADADEEEDEETKRHYIHLQESMKSFLSGTKDQPPPKKKRRLPYFDKLGLQAVTKLTEIK